MALYGLGLVNKRKKGYAGDPGNAMSEENAKNIKTERKTIDKFINTIKKKKNELLWICQRKENSR